ncbi:MAG TPA: TolC family protein [Verrucomicrobiae bacterium]|jgi:outer membrane protein TolC
MHFRILLGIVLSTVAVASAQTTNSPGNIKPLSLHDCINLALTHNLDLRIEHATMDIAGDMLTGAYGAYDPIFSFGATRNFVSDPGDFDTRKFNPYLPSEINQGKIGPDISGSLPIGFSYDFSGKIVKTSAVTDFTSNPKDAAFFPDGVRRTNDYDAEVGLSMRQHLLKDSWIDSDREVLQTRRTDLKISQQALRFQVMTTLLAVELAYDDLIDAREEIRVQENAVNLRHQFVGETQRRVQVGELPPLEDAQAQSQFQDAVTALAQAHELFTSRQNILVGLLTDNFKDWADAEVQATDPLVAVPEEFNRSRSFQAALTNRPDLVEARMSVQKAGVMVKFRLNQLYPSFDLVGGYGGLGSEPHSGGASLNDAFSFGNPEYSYGAVVSFPLANAAARGNYKASKASRQIAELQLQKAEQQVLLQVADYVNRAGSSFSQVGSTHQARVYAEQALDAETKKFQNGLATSFEVLQFQEILTSAQTAEIRAKVAYNKAQAQLAFGEGSTMERHHLSLGGK